MPCCWAVWRSCLELLSSLQGGSPYGAGTLAAGDGSRQPTATELDIARHQVGDTGFELCPWTACMIV